LVPARDAAHVQLRLEESYWPADPSMDVRPLTVGDLLREAAEATPESVAVVEGIADRDARRRWTYAELLEQSEKTASALLHRFQPGERVAIWAPNSPEWLLLEYGAALAGIVLVTVNPAYRPKELAWVLGQSGASGIVMVPEYRGSPMAAFLDEVRPDLARLRDVILLDELPALVAEAPATSLPAVAPDDPAQIQYTSGTTGFPKGALLHHLGIVNNSNMFTSRLEVGEGDVYLNPMPLFHTGGCVQGALGCLWRRARHVLVSPGFDPALMVDLVEHERVNIIVGVPTMLVAMIEQPDLARRDLSSATTALSGGSTVPPELVRRIERELGVRFGIVYGQTEASPVITQTRLDDTIEDKADTVGQPLPQVEVKVIDAADGSTVPAGAVGELCARGYQVMTGYYEMPDKTAEAIDADGWLHTGDLATMDERGYLRIVGRLRDMIIRGGENIYPREIEDVLFTHPAVAEAAVVGIPDPKWGEVVGAFIRPAADARPSEQELFAHVRAHLAPHKTPTVWRFVDAYPLTPSGKIKKYELVEEYQAAQSAQSAQSSPSS
jgi:fatty-acyl-CoA synthase